MTVVRPGYMPSWLPSGQEEGALLRSVLCLHFLSSYFMLISCLFCYSVFSIFLFNFLGIICILFSILYRDIHNLMAVSVSNNDPL